MKQKCSGIHSNECFLESKLMKNLVKLAFSSPYDTLCPGKPTRKLGEGVSKKSVFVQSK